MAESELEDQFVRLSLTDSTANFAQVVFPDISDVYPTYEDLKCAYTIMPNADAEVVGGRIGLFKVGFSRVEECITDVDVQNADTRGSVVFKADDLPKQDGEVSYYQFCYITLKGDIRGMSTPFYFMNLGEDICVEDIENDLLIIQTRTTILETKLKKAVTENKLLLMEKNHLVNDLNHVKIRNDKCEEDLEAMKSMMSELKEEMLKYQKQALEDKRAFEEKLSHNDHFINDMRVSLTNLSKENQELNRQLNDVSSEKILLKETNTELQKKLRDMIVNEASLNLEIMSKNSLVTRLKNDNKFLEKSLGETVAKLKVMEEKMILQQNHCDSLTIRLIDADSMLAAMAASKAIATRELELRTREKEILETVKVENANLKALVISKEGRLTKLENDLKDVNGENKTLKQDKVSMKAKMGEVNKECEQLQLEVKDLQHRLTVGADEYRKKYVECYKAQKKVTKLQNYIKVPCDSSTIGSNSTVDISTIEPLPPLLSHDDNSAVLNEEQKAKIRAEMENQLQMFQSSNSAQILQQPLLTAEAAKGFPPPPDSAAAEDGNASEILELQSNCSSDSQFFDFGEHPNGTNEVNWSMLDSFVAPNEEQFYEAAAPEEFSICVSCPICQEQLPSHFDVNEHIDAHLYYTCPVCKQKYDKDLEFFIFFDHVNSHLE